VVEEQALRLGLLETLQRVATLFFLLSLLQGAVNPTAKPVAQAVVVVVQMAQRVALEPQIKVMRVAAGSTLGRAAVAAQARLE
jgi:hypothetical protein